MGLCNFCGFCSGYVCYMYFKVLLNVNILLVLCQEKCFELWINVNVLKVNLIDDKFCVIGVIYVDGQGCEMEQLVDLVIIGVFQFYNVYLMLFFGIGKLYNLEIGEGVVGCNFVYQNMIIIKVIFDKDIYINLFIGVGGNGVGVDDFNVDNFDYGVVGFVGGLLFWVNQVGIKFIFGFLVLLGILVWGSKWKVVVVDIYIYYLLMDVYGVYQFYWQNYFDFDLNYKNVFGQLLLCMIFDWQENDIKMVQFMFDKMVLIVKVMKLKYIFGSLKNVNSYFDIIIYQIIYMNGGVVMGEDLKISVVNCYL